MSGFRSLLSRAVALLLAPLVVGPALALTGTVTNDADDPLEGARVCYLSADVELLCSGTDATGFYELPDSELDRIRFSLDGYLPRVLAAVQHDTPVVLQRSATLLVRLRDAPTGEPIGTGEIFVFAPNGRRLGPFPVNRAGVRVRSLAPGTIRISADVDGYEQQVADSVELAAGEETEFTVEMSPR